MLYNIILSLKITLKFKKKYTKLYLYFNKFLNS